MHPLEIDEVRAGPGLGRVGLTFCPGKKQAAGLTGGWNRDLPTDVERIRNWGAAVVVTLVEQHEIVSLEVTTLGGEIERRHMEWLHLPIADVSIPAPAFEREWNRVGPGLRARLRDGFDVLIHCKGGLGRAGTIAARLLVELGWNQEGAIEAVRGVRPGAIETSQQLEHVRRCAFVPEQLPSPEADAILDRAKGALFGLAVGDAVGTTLEFKPRDNYSLLTDMVGGGPFQLRAGEWTDDTAMALALAESLIENQGLDPADLMHRFVEWRDHGAYSCTGTCFDIGITVSSALHRWTCTGDPFAGSSDPMSAGNGSLMRLAPVALRYWHDRDMLAKVAADQSRTTHGAADAIAACVAFADMLADAIEGRPRSEVLHSRVGEYSPAIAAINAGSWRGKARDEVHSSGYVAHSLEAALWSVSRTTDFSTAILTASNLGGDADTTAAITGQLAGALYGLSGIPRGWLAKLAWRERIETLAQRLADAA